MIETNNSVTVDDDKSLFTYRITGFDASKDVSKFSYTSSRVARKLFNSYSKNQFKVFGYLGDWSQYDERLDNPNATTNAGRGFDFTTIDPFTFDKIIIGFLGITGDKGEKEKSINDAKSSFKLGDWCATFIDPWGDLLSYRNCGGKSWVTNDPLELFNQEKAQGVMGAMRLLKSKNVNLNLSLSVGGWTMSEAFHWMAADKNKRSSFIKSISNIYSRFPMLNEIDIDWEYPGAPGHDRNSYSNNDSTNFVELIRELKLEFNRIGRNDVKISIAASASVEKLSKSGIQQLMQVGVTGINLMTYDFFGTPWSTELAHHSNLNSNASSLFSISKAVDYLESIKIPLKQVFIGYAGYSRNAKNANITSFSPLKGTYNPDGESNTTGTFESGSTEFYDLLHNYYDVENGRGKNGFQLYTDTIANADYLYNPISKLFMSIDTPRSVYEKSKFVVSKGLGGIFTWTLNFDNGLLYNAAREGLGSQLITQVYPMANLIHPKVIQKDVKTMNMGSSSDTQDQVKLNTFYYICQQQTKMVLDCEGDVYLRERGDGNDYQHWSFTPVSGEAYQGYFTITQRKSGLVLDCDKDAAKRRKQSELNEYQMWRLDHYEGDYFFIVQKATNEVLDCPFDGKSGYRNPRGDSNPYQKWRLIEVPSQSNNSYFYITQRPENKVLTGKYLVYKSNKNTSDSNQLWRFEPVRYIPAVNGNVKSTYGIYYIYQNNTNQVFACRKVQGVDNKNLCFLEDRNDLNEEVTKTEFDGIEGHTTIIIKSAKLNQLWQISPVSGTTEFYYIQNQALKNFKIDNFVLDCGEDQACTRKYEHANNLYMHWKFEGANGELLSPPIDNSGKTYPIGYIPYLKDWMYPYIWIWKSYDPSLIDGIGLLKGIENGKVVGVLLKTGKIDYLSDKKPGYYTWVYHPDQGILYKWNQGAVVYDENYNYSRVPELKVKSVICSGIFNIRNGINIDSIYCDLNSSSGYYEEDNGSCLGYVQDSLNKLGIVAQHAQLLTKKKISISNPTIDKVYKNFLDTMGIREGYRIPKGSGIYVSRQQLGINNDFKLHLDIGGEGRTLEGDQISGFESSLNLNAQENNSQNKFKKIPYLVYLQNWETNPLFPFQSSSIDYITIQGAPLTNHNVYEFSRLLRPGGKIGLWIDPSFSKEIETLRLNINSPRNSFSQDEFDGKAGYPKITLEKPNT